MLKNVLFAIEYMKNAKGLWFLLEHELSNWIIHSTRKVFSNQSDQASTPMFDQYSYDMLLRSIIQMILIAIVV